MKKGSQIGVDGRFQSRSYEGNDGKTVYVTEVVADSVQFLESKSKTGDSSNKQSKETPYDHMPADSVADAGEPIDKNDNDLPF